MLARGERPLATEREAQRNIELMWLTGKLAPDFKTIADFRRDNGEAIREPPARLNLVQIGVQINLEQRDRMVRGTTGCFRHHACKSQRCQIQLVDKGVDHADRIVFGHVVVKTVRKQCYLTMRLACSSCRGYSPP